MAALLLVLLLLPSLALATEEAFVSPTRDPNASEYSTKNPEELQDEHIVAHSFILMERSTGEVLRERRADELRYPASTTKILTALMALNYGEITDTLTVSASALNLPDDAQLVPFKEGEVITLQDALYAMMLRSGNEAANAVAEYVSGDIETFVEQMNETAYMLGCRSTHFVNPHGMPDELHVTTARDLALIFNACLDHEAFRTIIAAPTYTLSGTEKNPPRQIATTNLHIVKDNNYYYRYSIGGKTGFTYDAGYVLVEAAEKDGVELIAVIMYSGAYSRWPDTSRLFQYGFSQYKSMTPEEIYNTSPTELRINGFDTEDSGLGELKLNIRAVDPTRVVRITGEIETVDRIAENYSAYTNIRWLREARAPVEAGEVMGILTFYPDGEESAQYELIASRSVKARVDAPPTLEEIEAMVLADPSPFPPFALSWALPPILILLGSLLILRMGIRLLAHSLRGRQKLPKPTRRRLS